MSFQVINKSFQVINDRNIEAGMFTPKVPNLPTKFVEASTGPAVRRTHLLLPGWIGADTDGAVPASFQ